MRKFSKLPRTLAVLVLALLSLSALADSWPAPATKVTPSSNGAYRVTIVPKSWGVRVARPEDYPRALATVEHFEGGKWRAVWEKSLVNELAPTRALLANDGSHLVTFDNWGNAGFGDHVVVIYDGRGRLVRKLAVEEILPPAYVRHLPRSVSSRWWGGEHRLVERDSFVELQIVEAGARPQDSPRYVPVRIRLADGAVIPPSGAAWARATAKVDQLEAKRRIAWGEYRRMRINPLPVPTSADTAAWQRYRLELGERIFGGDAFSFGGIVLAAPGAKWGDDAGDVESWVGEWRPERGHHRKFVLVSPTSDRLTDALVTSLRKRKPGSMKGLHLVFVGTAAEGRRVSEVATRAGARLTLVDRTKPFAAGKPPPLMPPDNYIAGPAH